MTLIGLVIVSRAKLHAELDDADRDRVYRAGRTIGLYSEVSDQDPGHAFVVYISNQSTTISELCLASNRRRKLRRHPSPYTLRDREVRFPLRM